MWSNDSVTERTWNTLPVGDTRSQIFMRRHEPDSYSVHGAESDTENEQLEWEPETIDDDGYPLVDEKTGPPWYLFHVTDLWTRLKQVC